MAHRTWAPSELTPYQLCAETGAGHPGCGAVVSRMPWGDPPATNISVKGEGAATCPDSQVLPCLKTVQLQNTCTEIPYRCHATYLGGGRERGEREGRESEHAREQPGGHPEVEIGRKPGTEAPADKAQDPWHKAPQQLCQPGGGTPQARRLRSPGCQLQRAGKTLQPGRRPQAHTAPAAPKDPTAPPCWLPAASVP